MCRRNICSIPLEFLLLPPPSHVRSLPSAVGSWAAYPPGSSRSSFSLSLSSVSSSSSNFFLHRVRPASVCRVHPRVTRATAFAGEGIGPSPSPRCRQVYFYSIRFIRLNMTCGYSPGDIFPILRDDIPTPAVPRVSCILCPYRSSARARARCRHPPTAGKIRTILSRIIAASGKFMDVPARFLAARGRGNGRARARAVVAAGSISEISPRYFLQLLEILCQVRIVQTLSLPRGDPLTRIQRCIGVQHGILVTRLNCGRE